MTIHARIWFRKGGFDRRMWTNIVEGYRGEIISDLPNGTMIYTGACETREECIAELVSHLKEHGLSGKLRIAA